MKIIDSITIRYFRSIYTLTLNQCEDITIITGKNDVGKSNILKALNLFFCQQSDYLKNYNFSDDYSIIRKEDVKKDTIRGQQFISISVRFLRGNRMKNSLPPIFTVTKRWDMHSQECKMTSDVQQRMKSYAQKAGIRYSEKTTNMWLSAYLNKIKYIYIPAIKDDRVFRETLNILQQNLFDAKNKAILDAPIEEANKAVQNVVEELQTDFKTSTGIPNFIALPNTLNYTNGLLQVNTQTMGGIVSIDKRGDGIRTHYIPKILNYVAAHSKDIYLWGFEEPENSYEYRRCIQVAKEFDEQYSKNCQIFITSHSPAFFANDAKNKTIVRVGRNNGKTIILNDDIPLDEELGYIELYREFVEKVKVLESRAVEKEEQIASLKEKLEQLKVPIILTEGKTDAALLKLAIKKLKLDDFQNWEIQPISGKTTNNTELWDFINGLSKNINPPTLIIGMFDRDTELKLQDTKQDIRDYDYLRLNKNVYVFSIPVPHNREEPNNVSIEHYFTDSEIQTLIDGKRLFIGTEFYPTGVHKQDGRLFSKDKNKIGTIKIIEHESNNFVTQVDGSGDYSISKTKFVECIESEKPGFINISFEEFRKIFDVLNKIQNDSLSENSESENQNDDINSHISEGLTLEIAETTESEQVTN